MTRRSSLSQLPNDLTRVYDSMRPWSMPRSPASSFEKEKYFEGCMPIEVMAKRYQTMLCGGEPVDSSIQMITKARDGSLRHPCKVVQLCQDNAAASLYNIVGFKLTLNKGIKRVFQMIPVWTWSLSDTSHAPQFLHGFQICFLKQTLPF